LPLSLYVTSVCVLYSLVFLNFTFFYFYCHILATCTFDTCFIKYQSINQSYGPNAPVTSQYILHGLNIQWCTQLEDSRCQVDTAGCE